MRAPLKVCGALTPWPKEVCFAARIRKAGSIQEGTVAKEEIDVSRRRLFFGFLDRIRGEENAPVAAASETAGVLAKANAAFAAGDFAGACALYREFLAGETGNLEARQRLGECLYRQGQHIQAKVEFERILQKKQKDNRALLFLGLVLARLDRVRKAAVVWKLFFDPHSVLLQRELNFQIALVETAAEDQLPAAAGVADAVEKALAQTKPV
jgi:tetratricopeptide (TPR) repeat protein